MPRTVTAAATAPAEEEVDGRRSPPMLNGLWPRPSLIDSEAADWCCSLRHCRHSTALCSLPGLLDAEDDPDRSQTSASTATGGESGEGDDCGEGPLSEPEIEVVMPEPEPCAVSGLAGISAVVRLLESEAEEALETRAHTQVRQDSTFFVGEDKDVPEEVRFNMLLAARLARLRHRHIEWRGGRRALVSARAAEARDLSCPVSCSAQRTRNDS